jgi:hypothetical protein
MHLRVTPVSGLSIRIEQGIIFTASGWKIWWDTTQYDLTVYLPSSGAVFSLVSMAYGGVQIKTGSAAGSVSELASEHIPTPDDNTIPLAAIKLYAGQTSVTESIYLDQTELLDLRFALSHRDQNTEQNTAHLFNWIETQMDWHMISGGVTK